MAPCALNIPPFIEKTALDDYSDGIIFCCLHASWVYMYFLFFSIVIMMSLKKRACSQLALPKQIKVKKTRICNDCSTFIDYSGNNWGSISCRRILVTLTCRLQGAGIIPNPWMACPAPEPQSPKVTARLWEVLWAPSSLQWASKCLRERRESTPRWPWMCSRRWTRSGLWKLKETCSVNMSSVWQSNLLFTARVSKPEVWENWKIMLNLWDMEFLLHGCLWTRMCLIYSTRCHKRSQMWAWWLFALEFVCIYILAHFSPGGLYYFSALYQI